MRRNYSAKQVVGTLIYDWPRFLLSLRHGVGNACAPWVWMRNRADRLVPNSDGPGVVCGWEHTRTIHLCDVFPVTGRWLLRRALRDWPIRLLEAPAQVGGDCVCWRSEGADPQDCGAKAPVPPLLRCQLPGSGLGALNSGLQAPGRRPHVSFLIGHRGEERAPLLLATLRSIAAQEDVAFECIVVEQDIEPRVRDRLPSWVRYLHTPPPRPDMPYCRSWTFNAAAGKAWGQVLICHDSDILVPAGYAREVMSRVAEGYQAVQPTRFVFYLDCASTASICERRSLAGRLETECVVEGLGGGGSIAITRDAFERIGGFDEEFVGWGGEDVEFWDRCGELRVWRYGYLPLVHLWHAPAPKKASGDRNNKLMLQKLQIPRTERIMDLSKRHRTQ